MWRKREKEKKEKYQRRLLISWKGSKDKSLYYKSTKANQGKSQNWFSCLLEHDNFISLITYKICDQP